MKPAEVTRSWIVYPPNYVPGHGYTEMRFLKDAWNKACSLGEGAVVISQIHKRNYRKGLSSWETGVWYEVGQ